jgi:hypothetical protein
MAEANLKLLGEAVKHFREQAKPKKISQFQLAVLMNWEGTAPIVEIEKGRRHPRPETLDALGEALQLSPADIAYLHGLAGYRAVTTMPPIEQIKRVLEAIEPDIAQRRFPVYVMDYQFRFWMMNSALAVFEGGSLEVLANQFRYGIDGVSMGFDTHLLEDHDDFPGREAMEREALFRFKSYNLYRRHEPFYLAYPDCMRERLKPEDYTRFVHRWNEVDVRMQDIYTITPQLIYYLGTSTMVFNVHMVEIMHLDRLFFVAYYEPSEDGTGNRERCETYFTQYSLGEKCCLRAWDYWENGRDG